MNQNNCMLQRMETKQRKPRETSSKKNMPRSQERVLSHFKLLPQRKKPKKMAKSPKLVELHQVAKQRWRLKRERLKNWRETIKRMKRKVTKMMMKKMELLNPHLLQQHHPLKKRRNKKKLLHHLRHDKRSQLLKRRKNLQNQYNNFRRKSLSRTSTRDGQPFSVQYIIFKIGHLLPCITILMQWLSMMKR